MDLINLIKSLEREGALTGSIGWMPPWLLSFTEFFSWKIFASLPIVSKFFFTPQHNSCISNISFLIWRERVTSQFGPLWHVFLVLRIIKKPATVLKFCQMISLYMPIDIIVFLLIFAHHRCLQYLFSNFAPASYWLAEFGRFLFSGIRPFFPLDRRVW